MATVGSTVGAPEKQQLSGLGVVAVAPGHEELLIKNSLAPLPLQVTWMYLITDSSMISSLILNFTFRTVRFSLHLTQVQQNYC